MSTRQPGHGSGPGSREKKGGEGQDHPFPREDGDAMRRGREEVREAGPRPRRPHALRSVRRPLDGHQEAHPRAQAILLRATQVRGEGRPRDGRLPILLGMGLRDGAQSHAEPPLEARPLASRGTGPAQAAPLASLEALEALEARERAAASIVAGRAPKDAHGTGPPPSSMLERLRASSWKAARHERLVPKEALSPRRLERSGGREIGWRGGRRGGEGASRTGRRSLRRTRRRSSTSCLALGRPAAPPDGGPSLSRARPSPL